ncbi:2-aminoethylphosphonate--pyruvate transaminase [Rhizobium sp. PP-F2F-G36]|nr:2-aminoethylphosphonate--pyruvate transaminase [Rhizobium sp. PP-F2F-G36]
MAHENLTLLTPGPLTTSHLVRKAMERDWGSRDSAFINLTSQLRSMLADVANGTDTHVAIPIGGPGTSAVEAAIGTLVRPTDKLLVLVNGAYGERVVEIALRLRLPAEIIRGPENQPIDTDQVEAALRNNPEITHVALVHCETTTGVLNPLEEIARIVARFRRLLILDAMSSFGALPIDVTISPIAALVASSNKCLESVPGVGFVVVERTLIAKAASVSPSLSLDLHAQWAAFEAHGQWRFTPPVQVVAALVQALHQLKQEGGPPARLNRYQRNMNLLLAGMQKLGFVSLLARTVQAPIIATFLTPTDKAFVFRTFYESLLSQGFLIYPGKTTAVDSFRVGCIGAIDHLDMERFLSAAAEAKRTLKILF